MPGKIEAASNSDFQITLTNLMANCADVLDVKLGERIAEDSQSILSVQLKNENPMTGALPIEDHFSKGFLR